MFRRAQESVLDTLANKVRNLSVGLLAVGGLMMGTVSVSANAEKVGWPEKEELKFGFIKLTDMAPLAVAYEKGFLKTKAFMSRWKHRQTGRSCWIA